jgi:hypothetical protein
MVMRSQNELVKVTGTAQHQQKIQAWFKINTAANSNEPYIQPIQVTNLTIPIGPQWLLVKKLIDF